MAQFGLTGWLFEFDNAKRRFGSCLHNPGTWCRQLGTAKGKITLSRPMTLSNDQPEVEDTIRHEIAHALCERKEGHGAAWKAMCKRTGAKPVRCIDHDTTESIKGDWSAACGVCGRIYYKFREPKGDYYCPSKECKQKPVPYVAGVGRYHPARKLVFRHKDALPEVKAPRSVIEAMKAHLRTKEQEPGAVVKPNLISEASRVSTERSMMQCVKCDAKSLGSKECPGCGGELKPSWLLEAEKATLKRRIAELEKKVGK